MLVMGSWDHAEHRHVLKHGQQQLWPRRRHGRRRGALGEVVRAVRGGKRALGGGEKAAGLTVDRTEGSASSGKLLRRRIDGGDLRHRR